MILTENCCQVSKKTFVEALKELLKYSKYSESFEKICIKYERIKKRFFEFFATYLFFQKAIII